MITFDEKTGCLIIDPPMSAQDTVAILKGIDFMQKWKRAIDQLRILHSKDGHGQCRHCLFAYPCRTIEIIDDHTHAEAHYAQDTWSGVDRCAKCKMPWPCEGSSHAVLR